MNQRLLDRLQLRLRQEQALSPNFYKPSPGQLPDHVHHRVARTCSDETKAYLQEQVVALEAFNKLHPSAGVAVDADVIHQAAQDALAAMVNGSASPAPEVTMALVHYIRALHSIMEVS